MEAIDRLRQIVGEDHWKQLQNLLALTIQKIEADPSIDPIQAFKDVVREDQDRINYCLGSPSFGTYPPVEEAIQLISDRVYYLCDGGSEIGKPLTQEQVAKLKVVWGKMGFSQSWIKDRLTEYHSKGFLDVGVCLE